jgi:hypothetical protein
MGIYIYIYIYIYAAEGVKLDTKERTPSATFFVLSVAITLELVLPLLLVHARR